MIPDLQSSSSFTELSGVLFEDQKTNTRINQVLVGYTDEQTGAACGSITYVRLGSFSLLVDCGLPTSDLSALIAKEPDCSTADCVLITHFHSDHIGLLHSFDHSVHVLPDDPNAAELLYEEMRKCGKKDARTHVELLRLSGHSTADLVLLVRPHADSDELIVIAGDLFEDARDYSAEEPAVPALDEQKLADSRQRIRALNPSIVVPGHGPAFRLRPAASRLTEFAGRGWSLRCLAARTALLDAVWLLAAGEAQVLINPRARGLPTEFDSKEFEAIVVLEPSGRSSTAIGRFRAKRLFMGNDVLCTPASYHSLGEGEWIVENVVRVVPSGKPEGLNVEIYEEDTIAPTLVIDSSFNGDPMGQ